MKYNKKDELQIFIADSRTQMGELAGHDASAVIKAMLQYKDEINVMFAAAPSQNDVLAILMADKEIPWNRIHAYHMDEYIGLSSDAPQGFGNYLRGHVFNLAPFASVDFINPETKDPEGEAARYEKLLTDHPIDLCILGIGENGHLAFNDPAEADFHDPRLVKIVHLDERCRQQQVNDGCFSSLDLVPKMAMTVTLPGLLRAKVMLCIVPTINKAEAVRRTLTGSIEASCPATILRTKPCSRLYLDPDSASLL